MKKFFISGLFIIGFSGYVAYSYFSQNTAQTVAVAATSNPIASTASQTTSSASTGSSAPPTPAATNTPAPAVAVAVAQPTPAPKAPTGKYVNGTYTGEVADAYYGNIQVEAVISGGKLTNVIFLQYPNDRSTSRYINQQAMPQLKAEAIQAQSANVDGVSGASDSSSAFVQSLSSALSQAKA